MWQKADSADRIFSAKDGIPMPAQIIVGCEPSSPLHQFLLHKLDSEIMRDQKIILPLRPLRVGLAIAGPLAYGVCQAGCPTVVMACYVAAGATWRAIAGAMARSRCLQPCVWQVPGSLLGR